MARFYDPVLGRFSSPDSIIPIESQGVQAWDRYAYVNSNPLRYIDSTGHCGEEADLAACLKMLMDLIVSMEDYGLLNPMAPYYMVPVYLGTQQLKGKVIPFIQSSEALVLTAEWYWELGEPERNLGIESEITQALINDEGVLEARNKYIQNNYEELNGFQYKFGLLDAGREFFVEAMLHNDWSTSFLGGYSVEIHNISITEEYNLVEFQVVNITSWESATRMWNYSFKGNEKRLDPGPGGTMLQKYSWFEKIFK